MCVCVCVSACIYSQLQASKYTEGSEMYVNFCVHILSNCCFD